MPFDAAILTETVKAKISPVLKARLADEIAARGGAVTESDILRECLDEHLSLLEHWRTKKKAA